MSLLHRRNMLGNNNLDFFKYTGNITQRVSNGKLHFTMSLRDNTSYILIPSNRTPNGMILFINVLKGKYGMAGCSKDTATGIVQVTNSPLMDRIDNYLNFGGTETSYVEFEVYERGLF